MNYPTGNPLAPLHFLDLAVIEHDLVYLSSQLDAIDASEQPHARLIMFDGQTEQLWYFHDSEHSMVSVCCTHEASERYQIALSDEGHVEWFHNAGLGVVRIEKLPDSGVRTGSRGRMSHIRPIGEHLYACGHNGQVYRRSGSDDWAIVDHGLFRAPQPLPTGADPAAAAQQLLALIQDQLILNCIDGFADDLYVVGDDGFMAHFDGTAWRQLDLPVRQHLQWVRCIVGAVWACGFHGCLISGTAQGGFRDLSDPAVTSHFWCLAAHEQDLYIAAGDQLLVRERATERIRSVNTALTPEVADCHRVDSRDGALWSMGSKDLVRLHLGAWTRLHHVDNERIGPA